MAFDPVLNLADLDGSNGFRIDGVAAFDNSGRSVSSAGDINGDGFDDLIIGAINAYSNNQRSGSSYVVFGSDAGFSSTLNLSALNGLNGFRIDGVAASDRSGWSVSSAGDVNGDGFDDLIIGAYSADPNGFDSGSSYVVFGSDAGFSSTLNLSSLNGSNGFRINGVAADDRSGWSVSSAGDINGDGIDDLIIGASDADPNGFSSGSSYVVFGSDGGLGATLNLSSLNGSNGFRIDGVATSDFSGRSVSSAGDINGDGFDDLIIGAPYADQNGNFDSGSSYVVFGSDGGFSSILNLSSLNGLNGFRIDGVAASDRSGRSVSSAGDINGDGFDDLVIGAFGADPNGSYSGSSYVMFGSGSEFSSTLNLSTLNGLNGFRIDGVAASDRSSLSVSSAGDINGDGFDDLIIGAFGADPNGSYSGSSYVMFGSGSEFSSTLNLSTLNGLNGFRIDGVAELDRSGSSVSSAGDINGDGIDDLIIGAFGADPNGSYSGSSYVVFGSGANQSPTIVTNDVVNVPENSTLVVDIQATDDSSSEGNGLTYSLSGGADQTLFAVDAATGVLSFLSAPDFENPLDVGGDNDYAVEVTLTDAGGLSTAQLFNITVTDVNEAPTIVTNGAVNVPENSTLVVDIEATDDSSSEGNGLTYSLSGGADQSLFTINAETGVLSFLSAPDFEQPLDTGNDNGYGVEVTLTDAGGLSTAQLFNISVTDENETPASVPVSPFRPDLSGGTVGRTVRGDNAQNLLRGSLNNDTLFGVGGNDTLYGLQGNDVIISGGGNDLAVGSFGNDLINGAAGSDTLRGDGGNDFLLGGNGNDLLLGGAGSDLLVGGQGADTLVGGGGQDYFRYSSFVDGSDVIQDFAVAEDVIDLVPLLNRTQFSGNTALEKFNNFVTLTQVGANTQVSINSAGSGGTPTNVLLATLEGVTASTLTASNFAILGSNITIR